MANNNIQTTVAGKKLMLFDKDGHSFAFATNHTLTINAETSTVSTKDHGEFGSEMVQRVTWNISSENIFPLDSNGADSEFSKLFDYMTTREAIDIYFGLKDETGTYADSVKGEGLVQGKGNITEDYWTKIGSGFIYKGKAIIVDLTLNAPDGEEASYSCTFQGVGSLTKVTA